MKNISTRYNMLQINRTIKQKVLCDIRRKGIKFHILHNKKSQLSFKE